jgi:hypothetical protein
MDNLWINVKHEFIDNLVVKVAKPRPFGAHESTMRDIMYEPYISY